jgi:hypothetical protein
MDMVGVELYEAGFNCNTNMKWGLSFGLYDFTKLPIEVPGTQY